MSNSPHSFESPPGGLGQPVWDLARWMPQQGAWTVDDYLELDGPAVEFDQGMIEVLDIPSQAHQLLVQFFFLAIHSFVTPRGLGRVLMAPIPVRLWEGKFREPDVVFIRTDRITDCTYCEHADLVLEVVSDGAANRRRDLEIKPREYAKAGIAEYWIMDPEQQRVLVSKLNQGQYEQVGEFRRGQIAASAELPGLQLPVAAWLDAPSATRS